MKVVITSSDYNDPQYAIYLLIISTLCYFLNIHLLAEVNMIRTPNLEIECPLPYYNSPSSAKL